MKKQVILNTIPKDIVLHIEVNDKLYYGVQINENWRGFISNTDGYRRSNSGTYTVFTQSNLTKGNRWRAWDSQHLPILIKNILQSSINKKVFQFDTFKELMEWVAETE